MAKAKLNTKTLSNKSNASLLGLSQNYIAQYGKFVIEQRAVPDFRDGLKPVQRRILWASRRMSPPLKYNGEYKKAARLVGDTMGKYHPHGDSSIYAAMVDMAAPHCTVPMIDGQGNWGTITENAAAYRYTECRPTKYADTCLMPSEYMNITNYIPNYDGADEEPVYFPALYPNLLLNGVFGIAVGVTAGIPPLHIDGLMHMIEMVIADKTITPKIATKYLRFNYPYRPHCTSIDEDIMEWLTTGRGSLVFSPTVTVDEDKKMMVVTNLPNFFNWDTIIKRLSQKKFDRIVAMPVDMSDKRNRGVPTFGVKFKTTVSRDDIHDAAKLVAPVFDITARMSTVYNIRHADESVSFKTSTLGELITRWTYYRVDLEKRFQQYQMDKLSEAIAQQELMMLAVANKKIIMQSLDQVDPAKVLVTKLKISLEQANYILDKQIRSLSRMSGDEIRHKITELSSASKTAKKHFNNPEPKVLADMNAGLKLVEAPTLPIKNRREK